jgi:hypothetical protein
VAPEPAVLAARGPDHRELGARRPAHGRRLGARRVRQPPAGQIARAGATRSARPATRDAAPQAGTRATG